MKRNRSTFISGLVTSLILVASTAGCTSADMKSAAAPPPPTGNQVAANDRTPDSLTRNSITITGGIRILNLGGGHESILTVLQARETSQPIRVKCIPGNHLNGVMLQLELGDDSKSKTLDLHSATVVVSPQASMMACMNLMDKLFARTSFYPAFINFAEDGRKFSVGF